MAEASTCSGGGTDVSAAGSVVASHLARAGLDVVVLEEGGHYTPAEYGAIMRTGREG